MIDSLNTSFLNATPPLRRAPTGGRNDGGTAPVESQRPVLAPGAASETRPSETESARGLEELKARDREVRAHEQAHIAAGGQHVRGGARFSYQRGTDGRYYAIGGEVSIDTAPVHGDPQATLRKAQAIQSAALAPLEPSSQDRTVAARARQMATQARIEIAQQRSQAGDEETLAGESARRLGLDARIAGLGGAGPSVSASDPLLDIEA